MKQYIPYLPGYVAVVCFVAAIVYYFIKAIVNPKSTGNEKG